jgi:2-amino-4-hydroxy-6-hydroxymethyldihydropteridine diphosphokinase
MAGCFLGLGSNMGDKKYYLDGAVKSLREIEGINVTAISSYYETEPFGVKDQPFFLNAVVEIETDISPRKLLQLIHKIEKEYDRVRKKRWGPRTLDIDILLYDDINISEPDLIIPHLYLEKRIFVLEPLAELEPDFILPSGRKIKDVIRELKNSDGV